MYIIGFNGPPECGKDTLAMMLATHMWQHEVKTLVKMESLSLPLRRIAYSMVDRAYRGLTYESFKREHFPQFKATGRQLMIDVSERFLKPTYGTEIMAETLLARNEGFEGVLLVRDCGFRLEVDPLIRKVGAENLYMVQVTRPGKTFEGDSREWIEHPHANRNQCVSNGGTLDDLRTEAGRIYGRLVNQCGWKL